MKRSDLQWFYDHLEFEMEDRQLEREGVIVDFYWDSSHIRQALLGMAAFYETAGMFRKDLFSQEATLVCCLASSGWFGEIKLLQPHEAEFLRLIDSEFGVGPVGPPRGGPSQFVLDSGLQGLTALSSSDLSRLRYEDISALVQAQAGNADTLFKVAYCAIGTWRTRIIRWKKSRLLVPSEGVLPYGEIFERKEFQKLREAFDKARPTSPVNNFADAVAICMLASQVRAFSEGARRIPRFFVSSSLYEKVLAETRLSQLLESNDGTRSKTILRHTDYYKLRAMFHPPEDVRKRIPSGTALLDESSDEVLQDAIDRIRDILDAQKPLTDELVATLSLGGRPLQNLIDDLRRYWFLENVWLPFAAATQIAEAVREYVETARKLNDDDLFKGEVEREVRGVTEALAHSSHEYRRVSEFWRGLQDASRRLRSSFEFGTSGADLFKIFGLLRFGIPEPERPKIEAMLKDLIEVAPSGQMAQAAQTRLVSIFESARSQQASRSEVMLIASVLWALHMDHYLLQLLSEENQLDHYALKIAVAAARFRLRREITHGWQATKHLEKEFDRALDPRTRLDLAVGLGYLYFHYFRCKTEGEPPLDQSEGSVLLDTAVSYARIAYQERTVSDVPEKRVYALNQILYYLLNAPPPLRWSEINDAASELVHHLDNPQVWQYRFDDTLARYFELREGIAHEKDKRRYQQQALDYIDRALRGSHGDEEIAKHHSRLQIRFGDLHGST